MKQDFDDILVDFKRELGRDGVWNFYNPKNLYLTDEQGRAYLELMGDAIYSSKFHDKTEILIRDNVDAITANFQNKDVVIMDLGPGYPTKTFPIVDELQRRNKEIEYWAVDVNQHFGNIAKKAILDRGVKFFRKKSSF